MAKLIRQIFYVFDHWHSQETTIRWLWSDAHKYHKFCVCLCVCSIAIVCLTRARTSALFSVNSFDISLQMEHTRIVTQFSLRLREVATWDTNKFTSISFGVDFSFLAFRSVSLKLLWISNCLCSIDKQRYAKTPRFLAVFKVSCVDYDHDNGGDDSWTLNMIRIGSIEHTCMDLHRRRQISVCNLISEWL